jgi:hypothetical protein
MFEFLRKRVKPSIVACDTRLLAVFIFCMAEEVAPEFASALSTGSRLTAEEVLPRIKLELCALYLHLCDRDAFREAGEEARNRFADLLFDALCEKIAVEIGVAECIGFTEFCNERQIEYSGYHLTPPDGTNPAGTLFWEFGKKLAFKYQGYNPIGVQLFTIHASNAYISLLEAINAGKLHV